MLGRCPTCPGLRLPARTAIGRSPAVRAWNNASSGSYSNNGSYAAANGSYTFDDEHPQDGSSATREMPIASTDFDDFGEGLNSSRRNSVHVIPPRKGAPQQLQGYNEGGLAVNDNAMRSEMKAVKAELSITKAEIQKKSSDLAASEADLRAKEAEVTLLRAAMTGRDISLRNAKAEASEAQAALKDKDEELQSAFQQLLSNAKERGDLRQQLLSIQDELSEARGELETWAQQGFALMKAAEKLTGQPVTEPEEQTAGLNGKSARSMKPAIDSDQMTKLLENLQRLSQAIADDAQADEHAYSQFDEAYND